ncbi:MAG: DinB family protein, partial [Hyphomicrobiaceae bacterium]
FGPRQLPVVSRGDKWVNGQSLKTVAEFLGIDIGALKHLPAPELVRRIDLIIDGASRFFAQFPEERIGDLVPGRPRSYAQLTWHLFNVVDAFLEHEQGIRLMHDAYNRIPPAGTTRADILAYGADVRRRLAQWWEGAKDRPAILTEAANVYYGGVTRHEFLERTTWHSGQHSRQLMWLLEDKCGVKPDRPLGPEMWQGLPMPEKVWDDEKGLS